MNERIQEYNLFRHGQSETNDTDTYQAGNQYETDPLTSLGRWQVGRFAEEVLGPVGVDVILSSSYLRCRQSSEIIQEVTNSPIIVPVITGGKVVDKDISEVGPDDVSLLRETDSPSELKGRAYHDPVAQDIKSQMEAHALEQDWRYSDEENYFDLWNRAGLIEKYLREREEEVIVVSFHGGIKKMLLNYIYHGNNQLVPLEDKISLYLDRASEVIWFDNGGYVALDLLDGERWQELGSRNEHLKTTAGRANGRRRRHH